MNFFGKLFGYEEETLEKCKLKCDEKETKRLEKEAAKNPKTEPVQNTTQEQTPPNQLGGKRHRKKKRSNKRKSTNRRRRTARK